MINERPRKYRVVKGIENYEIQLSVRKNLWRTIACRKHHKAAYAKLNELNLTLLKEGACNVQD